MPSFEELINDFAPVKSPETIKSCILVIDDDASIQRGLTTYFSNTYQVAVAGNGKEGIDMLLKTSVHCIILDIKMKGMNGFDTFPKIKEHHPELPIIFYSAFQNEHDLKTILNQYNPEGYFAKGDDIEKLKSAIDKSIHKFLNILNQKTDLNNIQNRLLKEKKNNRILHNRLLSNYKFDLLIGSSPKMAAFKQLCEKAVNSDITVLIQGETGTGKELIANVIHENSRRSDHPFFIQNCAAIPENLFESELFGHKKGSFSGAITDKKGIFELAHQGTVFLDEIGELPLAMQAKLLRLLQQGEVRPLGSNTTKYVDVRIISATNTDLVKDIKEGRFRKDLYYRLNVFNLTPPPLREIKDDIPLMVKFFIKKYQKKHGARAKKISGQALDILCSHSFPGNVRELENEIERAVVMLGSESDTIKPCHFSENILTKSQSKKNIKYKKKTLKEMVALFEQDLIKKAMKKHKGNKTHAADELGISRVGLNNKIQRYEMV
jgi:two-component system, NtrC family, response regulator HupR/HoxA